MPNMDTITLLISANAEWRVVRRYYPDVEIKMTPFGEWFELEICQARIIFVHGGWGKISAAASAQFAIQKWSPQLIINLGTCGGLAGLAQRGDVILAENTVVYDIYEAMGDPQDALNAYSAHPGSDWLTPPYPIEVRPVRLVSADRDIFPQEVDMLADRFGAVAADWESGAIAWVAGKNQIPCLILRGVSDVVSPSGGEAYAGLEVFHSGTDLVMKKLLDSLPGWIETWRRSTQNA
jgi:adenosylhomocysteine nucleosidase